MAVYLKDNPPRIRQFRSPRRSTESGVCVVHTAESYADETGPDSGAENVAAFIARRTNYGSYHDLVDSDSIVQLIDYDDEAFHDGTGSNPHSYGVSAAVQAHRWDSYSNDYVEAIVRNMARAAARYAKWLKNKRGIVIPARRITRAQSENRVPGFISHAERDPARRRDPGSDFRWGLFLDTYADLMGGATPEPKDWFDMATKADLAQVVDARVDQLDAQILRLKELHEQTRSQLSSTEAALSQTMAALQQVMHQLEEKRKADVLRDKQIHDMTRQMIQAHHGEEPIPVVDPRDAKGGK